VNGNRARSGLAGALALLLCASATGADRITEKIAQAIDDGVLDVSFRYRFEYVDQDAFVKEAYANTLRSRLTFAPRLDEDWGFLVEFDDVRHILSDNFNSTRNGQTNRPAVLDPKGTDLNQALVKFTGLPDTEIILGRQRILRANQRYFGGVGWRQNEQTYDSISVTHALDARINLYYAYIGQVKRIFGPDSGAPPADLDSRTHLLEASYAHSPELNVMGYAYLIDLREADALSNATFGVRVTGARPLRDGFKLSYAGEIALQDDYANHPVSYDANYILLEGKLSWEKLGVQLGYEVLEGGGQPGQAFRTPLATLHKFQGWADKFVGPSTSGTPPNGIEDLYVTLSADVLRGTVMLTYHDFDSESGGLDLGSEIDVSGSWKFGEHYSALVKLASFDAKDFADDTTKFWVMLTAAF
jgi:hypothetical protein